MVILLRQRLITNQVLSFSNCLNAFVGASGPQNTTSGREGGNGIMQQSFVVMESEGVGAEECLDLSCDSSLLLFIPCVHLRPFILHILDSPGPSLSSSVRRRPPPLSILPPPCTRLS
ncbi:unnamed protein product [Cyprideis torosa]|uniref:Uncharacterized protein n=1 Tax=Cyprideis torosa TaxID=163714 RepID=A0A7R8ZSP9_9CRUS|nr:unnamed protein product [Cyprideis torosa]CAG0896032.1 unnamed protein product [Cyprideis torosa]